MDDCIKQWMCDPKCVRQNNLSGFIETNFKGVDDYVRVLAPITEDEVWNLISSQNREDNKKDKEDDEVGEYVPKLKKKKPEISNPLHVLRRTVLRRSEDFQKHYD